LVPCPSRFKWIFALAACLAAALAPVRASAQAVPIRASAQAVPIRASAQAVPIIDASDLHQPTSFAEGWLVQTGDDPAWASPDYDDSHWPRFNAQADSLHTLFPNQRPSTVWYRLHIKVAPHDTSLAIEEYFLSSAFEIYANGVKILQVGRVSPYSANDYNARLLARIPRDQIAAGNIVIAVRLHVSSAEWTNAYPGLYYYNLGFGMEEALRQHMWLNVIGNNSFLFIGFLVCLGMIAGGLLLYSAQRCPEYLFLTLAYTADAIPLLLTFYSTFHTFPAWWHILGSACMLAFPYLIGRTYLAFMARPAGWRMQAFLVFVSIANCMDTTLSWMNLSTAATILLGQLPFVVLFGVVLPVILISAMRRGNRDAGILLVPLLLMSFVQLVQLVCFGLGQIPALRVPMFTFHDKLNHLDFGPFDTSLAMITAILATLSLALIILLRSNRQSRQQAVLENEIANAREVQQVILPEAREPVPGFHVESVYEPDQEVGGDFFQAIPDGRGGLLVVVGDVAGKGLPAAMLVSMLAGAIRTAAEFTSAPDQILAHLNRRLAGRTQGGFSTAIAAHLGADGTVVIANAGHLPPYLDGREMELPGALPLGIDARAVYEAQRFTLAEGSRLVFYSDGVVEAKNAEGELLGFERAAALSTESVEKISLAAKAFGQVDDITVVAIARAAVAAVAAA
jgi:sigma-B regulation protein RsbU (phosphoserine phosphatase)